MNVNSLIRKNFKVYNSSSALERIKDDLILYSFVVIMDEEKYIGLLTSAVVSQSGRSSVMELLQEDVHVGHDEKFREILNLMEMKKLPVLPVFRENNFIGVVIYSDLCQVCDLRKFRIAEESLRESQLIFKTAFELHSNLMAITTVADGIYIDVNNAFCSTLGFNKGELIGRSSVDLKIWTSRDAREEVLTLFQKHGHLTNHEVEYFAKNRSKRYGLFSIASVEIEEKRYLLTSMADITDQKKAEFALRESEQLTRSLIDIPGEHIILLTPDLYVLDINEQMLRSFDKMREEVVGHNSGEFIPQDILNKRKRIIDAVIASGEPVNHIDQRNGMWLSSVVFPIFDESGGVSKIGVSARDITGQKKLEAELEQHRNHLETVLEKRSKELFESEKRYREIINTITDYVYQVVIDGDNKVRTIHTDGCYNVTGYHSYEFINDPDLWINIIFDEERRTVKEFLKRILKDIKHENKIEHRIVHKNGSIRWINNTVIIHRNTDGIVTGYDGVIKDITEKKRIENEIKRLNQHIIKLQEEERQRVAQDLHDSVGQTILAAKINIEAYIQNPDRFKNQIDVGLSFLTQASNELREIYTGLYPTVLNDLGLEMAVRLLMSNSIEAAGIITEVNVHLNIQLSHDLNVSLYRIIQEIVSNIIKHSQATFVYISLTSGNNLLELSVKDNGIGFNTDNIHEGTSGYGLANIKSRLESYNGTMTIEKNTPTGISIYAAIELHDAD